MERREEDSNISIDIKEEEREEKERRGGGEDTRDHCRLSKKNTLATPLAEDKTDACTGA